MESIIIESLRREQKIQKHGALLKKINNPSLPSFRQISYRFVIDHLATHQNHQWFMPHLYCSWLVISFILPVHEGARKYLDYRPASAEKSTRCSGILVCIELFMVGIDSMLSDILQAGGTINSQQKAE
jgi:hypothetical protein